VREGWQVKALGDICDIARGGSPRPIQKFLTERPDGINWIKIGDATASTKYIYKTEEKIIPEGVKRSRLVKDGDFLLSNSMSFGRPYIMRTTGCIHDGWLVLSDKSGLFDQEYLYYFLGSAAAYRQFDSLAAGSTVRNLNSELVKRVMLPLPPLPEQQRIVAILDEAFAGLATATVNAEKSLKNARELFDSYLNSTFKRRGAEWIDRAVADVADHCLGKMLDRNKNRGEPKPYLRNLNVRWFDFDLSDVLEMRFEKDEIDRYSAIKGDLLICEGGYPGRAAIWERDEPIFFQKAIHRVRFHAPQLAKWFLYFLYIQDATGELRSHFTGAGIQHFTGQALGRFKLPIPSVIEVREHVAKFDELATQTRSLENSYKKKLEQIRDLKQAILHKAFSGNLILPPSQAIKEAAE